MEKKGKLFGAIVGNAILPGLGGAVLGSAVGHVLEYISDSSDEEEKELFEDRIRCWCDLVNDIANYPLQDRKAIMFLSEDDIYNIWVKSHPNDCEIKYLPYSNEPLEDITFEGNHIEKGVLYVYDPRNDTHYYPASAISQVLIKDKFREMKQVFESLGATRIDITFSSLKDEKEERNSNNSQNISGRYGAHEAAFGHSGSRGGSSHTSNFRQLEIHKQCTGKTSYINLNKCYWFHNDVIFQEEVRSIKAGSTLETNFVDTTQSYSSITSTRMDKIEAEYKYLESIGVSGMAQWDSSMMREISQTVVWNVHVICTSANKTNIKNNMVTWKDFYDSQSPEFEVIDKLWDYFNNRTPWQDADSAAEEMNTLRGLLSGDADFDAIINFFIAIVGLSNDQFLEEGKEAIITSLRQNTEVNYIDRLNLSLAYEAKEAETLDDFKTIVSKYKANNWAYINELFSYIVSISIDNIEDIFEAMVDGSTPQELQLAYAAYRIKTLLPSVNTAADGWHDWCDLCIRKNDADAFYCAQTAYDNYRNLMPAKSNKEAHLQGTISCYMLGCIIVSLGRCYYLGLGTEQNYSTAFRLFCQGYGTIKGGFIAHNNPACDYLAECYIHGYGTNVDLDKAEALYRENIENYENASWGDWSSTIDEYNNKIKELHTGIVSKTNVLSSDEQQYLDEFKFMLEDGEIGDRERRSLERLRSKLGLSASRVAELEASVNIPQLTTEEQEYLEEYREIKAEGEIRDRDRRALERLAQRNGISSSRAQELERMA